MRIGWLAALAAMMISTQADAARWVRFTFTGPGQVTEENVNDFEPPVTIAGSITASFAIDVEPNDPFNGGDPGYFSTGSYYGRILIFEGFSASVNAGTFEAFEQFTDTKAYGDSKLTFNLTNGASTFADIAAGRGGGSLRYYTYYGYSNREASATLTSLSLSDATGYEALSVTAVGRIVAVPEPATWAMMILGVGALGTQLRRRQRTGAAPAIA